MITTAKFTRHNFFQCQEFQDNRDESVCKLYEVGKLRDEEEEQVSSYLTQKEAWGSERGSKSKMTLQIPVEQYHFQDLKA